MTYEIILDKTKHISHVDQFSLVTNAKIKFEANKAGTLTFTMLPGNTFYHDVVIHNTIADLYINGEFRFRGIAVSESVDFYKRKTFTFNGVLSFLNESIQRPAVYNDTLTNVLQAYITIHNGQMFQDNRKFQNVVVNGFSGAGTLYRFTNYAETLTEMIDDFVDNFGGYFWVNTDPATDTNTLVYTDSPLQTSTQEIRIGSNLLDFVREVSTDNIVTKLIPIGAELDTETVPGIKDHVTITSVNGGLDYVSGDAATAWYGNIWRVVKWDNITTPANLLSRANEYIATAQWSLQTIEATAVDLGLAEQYVDQLHLLDSIRIVSTIHGIDQYFTLTKLDIDLDHPGNTQITLGDSSIVKLSDQVADNSRKVAK